MNPIGLYGHRSNSELHLITITLKGRCVDIRFRNPREPGESRITVKQRKFQASILAIIFACGLAAAAQQPQLPDPGAAPMSRQQQEQLGLQAMGEVYKQMPVLPDSHPLTQY